MRAPRWGRPSRSDGAKQNRRALLTGSVQSRTDIEPKEELMDKTNARMARVSVRTATSTTRLRACLLPALAALALPCLAQADAVTDWNTITWRTAASAGAPPIQTRINAIAHLAIHDALNSIDRRYQTYAMTHATSPGASPEAAIAAAAYVTLSTTVPAKAAEIEASYLAFIGGLSCPQAYPECVEDGIDVGVAAADAVLALRENDGSATPHAPYSEPELPGVYQPYPSAQVPAFGNWSKVRPFALNHGAQFRPGPSPLLDLGSATYAQEFQEVQTVGSASARAAAPNSMETITALYWAGGAANYNVIAQKVAAGRGLDMWQHARLFALVNMAQADAAIAVFDAKYHYKFWRPVTAIHASGNTDWESFLANPPYPDYTSGISILAGSASEAMRRFFGTDELPYSLTAAGIDRSFARLSQAEHEAAMSRVYAGIHFRTACLDGIRQGNAIGHYVFRHYLKPLTPVTPFDAYDPRNNNPLQLM